MKNRINLYEAKTHLSEGIKPIQETGEPYTICKNNKPVVDIVVHKEIPENFDPLQQDPKLKGTAVYLCDPFDHIISATAQLNGMTILTKDRIIPTYPKVTAVWA